jgi:multidrug efflux system membrane fusion protein
MNKIFRFAAVQLGVLLCLSGCVKQNNDPKGPPPPHVTFNHPVVGPVMEWDVYPGRLEAVDEVQIRSRVSGYLQSIHFKDGAEVQKGDLLFVIDPRPYEAALHQAEAELLRAQTHLELAKNDAERATRLLKSKAISEEEADARAKAEKEAEAALNSQKAAVAAARLNVDFTRITAPISGRISRKMITEGNLVNGNQGQSTLLTTIVSLDPIYCYFDADEQSALKYQTLLRTGKMHTVGTNQIPAEFELSNETNFPHHGFIDFVENQVNPTTGTLRMRAVFPNPGPQRILQPGYFGRVRVPGSEEYQGLLIAEQAVGTDQSQKFVYTLSSSNTVQYTPITMGPPYKGMRVVKDGLTPESKVIVNGLMSIRPGATVVPQEAPATQTESSANKQGSDEGKSKA